MFKEDLDLWACILVGILFVLCGVGCAFLSTLYVERGYCLASIFGLIMLTILLYCAMIDSKAIRKPDTIHKYKTLLSEKKIKLWG